MSYKPMLESFINEYENIRNEIIKLCGELTSDYDESHNLEHHLKVYENALEIMPCVPIQPKTEYRALYEMVLFSTLLHDVIDHKYQNNLAEKKQKLEMFLLEKLGENAKNIKWIIDNISYSKEVKYGYPVHENYLVQNARNIVSDADKLEAIGTRGLVRCRQFTMAFHPNANKYEILGLMVDHCREKLLRLKDEFIHTSKGKQMAENDHYVLLDFLERARNDTIQGNNLYKSI